MPHLSEQTAVIIILAGLAIAFIGFLWLVGRAFDRSAWWGVGSILPPVALLFGLTHLRRAWPPLAVILVGLAVAAAPVVIVRFVSPTIDLGERDKMVDGERHLTLTGWDKTDYAAALRQRPDTVVLFVANPDVTDATLESVKDMTELRELDLNDTQVTDAGLKAIAGLPNLKVLMVSRTKVTEAGVKEHLLSKPGLTEIHVQGLGIPTRVLREWKNADPKNRKFAN